MFPVEPQSVPRDTDAAAPERPRETELVDLHRKAANLPEIEQAKGMLVGYYGISADVAIAVLRRWSIRSNTELSTVCATLVAEGSHAADLPSASLRQALDRWQPPKNHLAGRRVRQGPRRLAVVTSNPPPPRDRRGVGSAESPGA